MTKKLFLNTLIFTLLALFWWDKSAEGSGITTREITRTHCLQDGTTIALHYRPDEVRPYNTGSPHKYADIILHYAAEAYNHIVYKEGFDTPGFTFASPDRAYCYDEDRTIDINIVKNSRGRGLSAPCYDIVKGQGLDYDAIILFPADYKGYLSGSTPGDISKAEFEKKIRATLFHEMLHLITYSYNKNIAPWYSRSPDGSYYQGGDWYVEGLARYFETISGSYHNFFSEGFERRQSDKIIVSQEGANYLMHHPSQSLKDCRYDYSLFWAFIHKRYGMDKIEEISRRFRFISEQGMEKEMPAVISAVLGEDFEDLLTGFGVAMYFKYFNPDIKKGLIDLKVMSMDDFSCSPEKRLDPWASNFITLNLAKEGMPGIISLKKTGEEGELKMSIFAGFQNGRIVKLRGVRLDRADIRCELRLADMRRSGVKELILIITNSSPDCSMRYRMLSH